MGTTVIEGVPPGRDHADLTTPAPPRRADPRAGGARRPLVLFGWLALLARFALQLVAILCADHVALVRQLPDDGFYYLEIANRLARGQGFTFDGIHSTNGFHPLWQFRSCRSRRSCTGTR